MLDYYGSIMINEDEIIERIIEHYQNKYETNTLKKIIKSMMIEGLIHKTYSVSGWMVFGGKDAIQKVEEAYQKKLMDAKKKLSFSKIFHERMNNNTTTIDPYLVCEILIHACENKHE